MNAPTPPPPTVTERVIEIVVRQLDVEPAEVTMGASFADLDGDSLDAIEIVMAVEEAFAIEVPDEAIKQMTHVRHLIAYVEAVERR